MIENFKRRILGCIDKGLDCFGESTKRVIYCNLEKWGRLKLEDVSDKPEEFSKALEFFFGARVVNLLEKNIASQIVAAFKLSPSYSKSLSDAIKQAKKSTGLGRV
jgi:hypothetical protein